MSDVVSKKAAQSSGKSGSDVPNKSSNFVQLGAAFAGELEHYTDIDVYCTIGTL